MEDEPYISDTDPERFSSPMQFYGTAPEDEEADADRDDAGKPLG